MLTPVHPHTSALILVEQEEDATSVMSIECDEIDLIMENTPIDTPKQDKMVSGFFDNPLLSMNAFHVAIHTEWQVKL